MIEIHEQFYGGQAGAYMNVGINRGLLYPEVSTCLTLTLVWTGANDVMAGAHFGINGNNAGHNPNQPSTGQNIAFSVRQLQNRAAMAMGRPINQLDPPRFILIIGQTLVWGRSNEDAFEAFNALVRTLVRRGGDPFQHVYDTSEMGAQHDIYVNRPSGFSIRRGTVYISGRNPPGDKSARYTQRFRKAV